MKKYFKNWIGIKSNLHYAGVCRTVKEGGIWWCAVGMVPNSDLDLVREGFRRLF